MLPTSHLLGVSRMRVRAAPSDALPDTWNSRESVVRTTITPSANIRPAQAHCQGTAPDQRCGNDCEPSVTPSLHAFPEPGRGELDGESVEYGEIAGKDQGTHDYQEQSATDMDELNIALKLRKEVEERVDRY